MWERQTLKHWNSVQIPPLESRMWHRTSQKGSQIFHTLHYRMPVLFFGRNPSVWVRVVHLGLHIQSYILVPPLSIEHNLPWLPTFWCRPTVVHQHQFSLEIPFLVVWISPGGRPGSQKLPCFEALHSHFLCRWCSRARCIWFLFVLQPLRLSSLFWHHLSWVKEIWELPALFCTSCSKAEPECADWNWIGPLWNVTVGLQFAHAQIRCLRFRKTISWFAVMFLWRQLWGNINSRSAAAYQSFSRAQI